jgi:hypothetical protein
MNKIQHKKEYHFMKRLLVAFIGLVSVGEVMASEPIQLSLVPDVAIYKKTERIEGVALSIWGENPQSGLALGFVNGSTGDSSGLSWSYIINYAENYKGVQWAMANYTKGNLTGWQAGAVNYAGKLNGLQLGMVNYAATGDSGVQVGFLNIFPENKWFSGLPDKLAPGMIFVNWSF